MGYLLHYDNYFCLDPATGRICTLRGMSGLLSCFSLIDQLHENEMINFSPDSSKFRSLLVLSGLQGQNIEPNLVAEEISNPLIISSKYAGDVVIRRKWN